MRIPRRCLPLMAAFLKVRCFRKEGGIMKRAACFSLAMLAAVTLCFPAIASCTSTTPIFNTNHPAFGGLSTTPADVRVKMWIYGKGFPDATGGGAFDSPDCPAAYGCDYGSISDVAAGTPATCADFDNTHMLYWVPTLFCSGAFPSEGGYLIMTDWTYAGYDGCADSNTWPNGDRAVVVAEDSGGNFGVISMPCWGWTQMDLVPEEAAAAIPEPFLTGGSETGGVWSIDLAWTAIDHPEGGHCDDDPAPPAIVTGYKVYVWTGTGTPPTWEHTTANGWQLAGGNSTVTDATANSTTGVTFPADHTKSQWVGLSLTFDSGFESTFTGQPIWVVAPTAAGVFAQASARRDGKLADVAWMSNVESTVGEYEVYWATGESGPFLLAATVPPQGNGHSYAATFSPPPPQNGQALFAKIGAVKCDGSQEWSPLLLVGDPPPFSLQPVVTGRPGSCAD
jgi:hypothetical protein